MLERLFNGWELAKESWQVLKLDKELLVFPLLSGLACVVVLASFALPLWASGQAQTTLEEKETAASALNIVILFAFYFANYFVIVFFNSGLVACAIIRFRGGDPTVGDGLRAASARLPQIVGWALVSATVGVILRLIESRSQRAGQWVSAILGAAWSIMTYFVVPVLVVEKLGPIAAFQRSLAILRRTWGEALGANFGIGIIVFLLSLVAAIPAVIGIVLGHPATVVVGVVVSLVLIILVSLASTALSAIIRAALYLYAAEGNVQRHFNPQLLEQAFVRGR